MVQFSHAGNTEWRTPVLLHIGFHNAGKLMKVTTLTVRNAMNKGNDIIVRKTGGTRYFISSGCRNARRRPIVVVELIPSELIQDNPNT